jgi:ABC-type nitrate/sulfonate/bicarbonate transport system ATPase subunit
MLEIKNMSAYFGTIADRNRAVGPLNLHVENGEICTIIGPPGCGKTTLLRTLAGVIKDFQGSMKINGTTLNPFHNKIAYIPQEYGLFKWKTIKENCLLPIKIRNLPVKDETINVLNNLAKQLQIIEILDRYPTQVSEGQLQNAAIARSLIMKPDILLMDEPFSSLDLVTRQVAQSILKDVLRYFKVTTLIVTHSIEEAISLGDRVIVLSSGSGKVIADITALHSKDYSNTSNRYIKLTSIIRQLIKEEWRKNKDEKNTSVC